MVTTSTTTPRQAEITLHSEELLARIRELVDVGNVRRVVIKTERRRTLIEIPLGRCVPSYTRGRRARSGVADRRGRALRRDWPNGQSVSRAQPGTPRLQILSIQDDRPTGGYSRPPLNASRRSVPRIRPWMTAQNSWSVSDIENLSSSYCFQSREAGGRDRARLGHGLCDLRRPRSGA